jgi:DNA polymerase/3'-5' exonuclease PolX
MIAHEQTRSGQMAENLFVGEKLGEMADLLEQQDASQFRVSAYRDAASYVVTMHQPIRAIYREDGRRGLEDLPTIGTAIAAAVSELLDSGRMSSLDRLRGSANPEKLLQTVPMIGPTLAHLIHDTLHIDTLEALEAAAIDGRLAKIKGIGNRRVASIRHSLNDMLSRRRPRRSQVDTFPPSVTDILAVDQEYRENADNLPTIKPRRFNETGLERIPILHTERGLWRFSALFSNTASAHQYGRTRDWVVIHYEQNEHPAGQSTVVTQHGGPLDGRRVIRGQERACMQFYAV